MPPKLMPQVRGFAAWIRSIDLIDLHHDWWAYGTTERVTTNGRGTQALVENVDGAGVKAKSVDALTRR